MYNGVEEFLERWHYNLFHEKWWAESENLAVEFWHAEA
jgi:hypothetical protein